MSLSDRWKNNFTIEQLFHERKIREDWINSDENDGRLSAGSSADLDLKMDEIEEINKVLLFKGVPSSEYN